MGALGLTLRSGGGGAPRAKAVAATVPLSTGLLTTVSTFGLLAPVAFAKTGGSSNLSIGASTGAISAVAAIGAGASQSLAGTVTGADGCVLPFTATLTGATVTPTPTPTPTVTLSAAQSQPEGNSGAITFTYTVTRSDSAGAVAIAWGFTAGTTNAADFASGVLPSGGTITIANGATSGTFAVQVAGDTTVEPNETFTVSIATPSGYAAGANMSATGTIINDDSSGGAAPVNTAAPTVSGSDYEGSIATASSGTWSGAPAIAKQWRRNDMPITGAIGDTYAYGRLDVGRVITCAVTATENGQSTTVVSAGVVGKFARDPRVVWLGNSKDSKTNLDSYRNAVAVMTNGYFANGGFGNQARSGDDLTQYKNRWAAVVAAKPDVLVLGDTTNEGSNSAAVQTDLIDDILELARAAGAVVLIERMPRLAGQAPGDSSDLKRQAVIANQESRAVSSATGSGAPAKGNPSLLSPAVLTVAVDQAVSAGAPGSTSNPMASSYDGTHFNVIGAWGQPGQDGAAKAIATVLNSLTSAALSYVGTGQIAGNTHTTGWDVNGTGGTLNGSANVGVATNYALVASAGVSVSPSKDGNDDQIIDITGSCSSHLVDAVTFTRSGAALGTRAVGDTVEFFYDYEITHTDGVSAPIGVVNHGILVGSTGSIFSSTGTAPVYQQLGVTIAAVTKSATCTVTTTAGHGFANGDYVAFVVNSGMTQLNNTIYVVADATSTAFAIKDANTGAYVDSSAFSTFSTTGAPKVGLLATLQVPVKGIARSQGTILSAGGVSANIVNALRFRPGPGINCRIKVRRVMVRPMDLTAYAAPYNQNLPGDGGLNIYPALNVASPSTGAVTATFSAAPGNVSGGGFADAANGGKIEFQWKRLSDNSNAPGASTSRSYVPGNGNAGQYYCTSTWTNALGSISVNSTTVTAT